MMITDQIDEAITFMEQSLIRLKAQGPVSYTQKTKTLYT